MMARSPVPAGRRLACCFPSTARETERGPGRNFTRMPRETPWMPVAVGKRMELGGTCGRCLISVTTAVRAISGATTMTKTL